MYQSGETKKKRKPNIILTLYWLHVEIIFGYTLLSKRNDLKVISSCFLFTLFLNIVSKRFQVLTWIASYSDWTELPLMLLQDRANPRGALSLQSSPELLLWPLTEASPCVHNETPHSTPGTLSLSRSSRPFLQTG